MITKSWNWERKVDVYKELQNDPEINIALKIEQLKSSSFDLLPMKDSLREAKEYLANPDKIEGISTGYKKLDDCIGGFADEELIVVSGGTGQGKTQFAQCLILNMALENNPVLFFTLEMPPRETTIRFIKMGKSKEIDDVLGELPIYYYHGTNATLPILDKAIEKGIELGIKCAVIDHLHFFAKSNDNQAAEIGNIAREIKLMARKYEIPIILISHIRKTNSPMKVPQLEDLKDSSGIAQDADMVLMAWRDMDSTSTEMKIAVRKNRRRGSLLTFRYDMDFDGYLHEHGEIELDDRI